LPLTLRIALTVRFGAVRDAATRSAVSDPARIPIPTVGT
jgi:hypothetical protein